MRAAQTGCNLMSIKIFFVVSILLGVCPMLAMPHQSADERIGFTVPAAPWTLTLPKDGLVVRQQDVKPDGQSAISRLLIIRGR
jgi:hypothetical protein